MKFLFSLFLLTSITFSQNKAIVPKDGTIVFEKNEIITDTLLYRNSFEKVFEIMILEAKKEVLSERGYGNRQLPDSINQQLNQMLEMMKSFALQETFSNKTKNLIKYHHAYINSEIEEFISTDGVYGEKNRITNFDDFENESLWTITGIEENKKETKIIKGFKCYKVIIYYFDLELPPGFMSLLNIMELWVTEDIKSKFHPFLKESEILEKYYPLEIKHSIKNVEGMFTLYEISEFSLK
jgi:hypothetical protein